MKDRSEIKTILGLTQNEMGMTLGVSRSLWSMFKTGIRDLPLHAKEKFSYLIVATEKRKSHSKEVNTLMKEELKNNKLALKKEIIETQLKIERINKEIIIYKRTRDKLFAAYETSILIASYNEIPNSNLLANSIRTRVENSLKKYNLANLNILELKKESLEMLKLQLEKKLKF